jgi:hypothetical protein
METPIAGSGLLWRLLREYVYAVPLRIVENVARIQAYVTVAEATVLSHGREKALRRTAFCLEMEGASSKT